MSFVQMFLFVAELVFLVITGYYFLKVKNKSSGLEILEIKLNAGKKKFDKESAALNELKKRLDEQKVVLDKQWNQLQTDNQALEERALKIENDRKLFDQQQSEFSRQKIETEQKQIEMEKLFQNFEEKWEQERQELQQEKEQLKAKINQLNILFVNLEAERDKLKLEKQKFEKSERYLSEKFNELRRLKAEFELQREQLLNHQTHLPKADEQHKIDTKSTETQRAENFRLHKAIEYERRQMPNLAEKSPGIPADARLLRPETNKNEQKEPVGSPGLTHGILKAFPKIEDIKKKIATQSSHDNRLSDVIINDRQIDKADEEKSIKLIPEIICWKSNNEWHLGIKFLSPALNTSSIRVIQNNIHLKKHKMEDEYWLIKSLAPLFVQWAENNEISFRQFELNNKGSDVPLIFKLNNDDQNIGRLVNYPTTGNYLVIVPADWERVANEAVGFSREAEATCLVNYVGYRFYVDEHSSQSFACTKKDGTMIAIDPQASRFHLRGDQIIDVDEQAIPLYGETLPIIVDQSGSWDGVGTIVVIEQADNGYVWFLNPQMGKAEQNLNSFAALEIARSSSSYFLIKLYDKNDDLIEMMPFRYVEGLTGIKVFTPPLFPGTNGHQPGYIKFYHSKKCTIELVSNHSSDEQNLTIRHNDYTVATIPPDPRYDQTIWQICDQAGRKITISFDMQRVWWGLANELNDLPLIEASDKLLEMSPDILTSDSNSGIRAWLPKNFNGKEISAGFAVESRNTFLADGNDRSIFIPLSDFNEFHQLHDPQENPVLKLWLTDKNDEWLPIAEFIFPLLSCRSDNCNFKTKNKNEMVDHIKSSHFPAYFKNLSYDEIRLKCNCGLPAAIYQCGYCGTYILAGDETANPTGEIVDHIEKCTKVDQENRRIVRFKQVKEADEIREKVIHELPVVIGCTLCGHLFENTAEDGLIAHLIQHHESELFSQVLPEKIAS